MPPGLRPLLTPVSPPRSPAWLGRPEAVPDASGGQRCQQQAPRPLRVRQVGDRRPECGLVLRLEVPYLRVFFTCCFSGFRQDPGFAAPVREGAGVRGSPPGPPGVRRAGWGF